MGDRLRIVVIGLPELGYLLEEAAPAGADVVTVGRGADIGAELAGRAKGATRETMLFVVADTGDPAVHRLPDTLSRGGFRAVVLAGLPGAGGTYAAHENLQVLSAPFSANDVLAALSGLPGDVPFFLPIAGGDRTFGDPQLVLPAFRANGRRERNGVVYPARREPDEDPLGPPVGTVPPPPPPPPPGSGESWPQPVSVVPPPPRWAPPPDGGRHGAVALVLGELPAPPPPGAVAHPPEPAFGRVPGDPIGVVGASGPGPVPRPDPAPDQVGGPTPDAIAGGPVGSGNGHAPVPEGDPAGSPVDGSGSGSGPGPVPRPDRAPDQVGGPVPDAIAGGPVGSGNGIAPEPEGDPAGGPVGAWEAGGDHVPGLVPGAAALMPDGVPAWARLPEVQVDLPDWAGPAAGPAPSWAAPRSLTTYNDEPVMPGARLPAVEPHRARQRGEVISVCSYKGGSGKCLTGDALIVDPATGVPHRLVDVVRDPGLVSVLTLDWTTVRPAPIAAKIDSGVKPTVRVAFRSGRSVTVTPHHPFLLADGWRPAEEIAVGEAAALPARLPFPAEPRRLPAAELSALVTRLSDHGCGRSGPDRPLPDAAYRLSPDQLARFLSLLWTADGTVGRDGTPHLQMADRASVGMVQHLLLRFGVQSAVTAEGGAWRLTVSPGFRAAFADSVPLCGPPGERLAAAAATEPKPRLDGDIHWDEVVAVTPAGIRQVWDLTVDGTHCFVANDIVVHNTTTALLAASTLARAVRPGGKRVALVDANTAQSSVATILQRPVRGSVLDLVRTDVDEALLAQALTPVPEAGDLDVLFGAPDLRSTDERLLTPALWRRIVATLRRTHDYVIVDTPVAEAVGHELFDDFVLRDSSVLLVVLDPNRETIHNNVEWLDIIGDPVSAGGRNFPPDRVAIVLNRADPQLVWNEHSVGDHFRRYHFLGAIPHSAAVQQAADDARLVQRFDPTVDRAVRTMLAALVDEPLLTEPDRGRAGGGSGLDRLLERLFGRRSS